jgi:hypothetical protein
MVEDPKVKEIRIADLNNLNANHAKYIGAKNHVRFK